MLHLDSRDTQGHLFREGGSSSFEKATLLHRLCGLDYF
jgi:hypothetical protein